MNFNEANSDDDLVTMNFDNVQCNKNRLDISSSEAVDAYFNKAIQRNDENIFDINDLMILPNVGTGLCRRVLKTRTVLKHILQYFNDLYFFL